MAQDIRINTINRAGEGRAMPASKPGELVANAGPGGIPEWSFMGNGTTTPTDVMGRIIDVDAKDDKALSPFVGSRDAAELAARRYLLSQNKHLQNQDPNEAIPSGELFNATTGPSLKDLLAPFAKNLDKLREAVAEAGLGQKENRMTGNVVARGRGLPMDPNI